VNSIIQDTLQILADAGVRNAANLIGAPTFHCYLPGTHGLYGAFTTLVRTDSSDGEGLAIKIARLKDATHLEREANNLDRVRSSLGARQASQIPKVLFFGHVRGHPFLVSTLLKGAALNVALKGPLRLRRTHFVREALEWITEMHLRTRVEVPPRELEELCQCLTEFCRETEDVNLRQKAMLAAQTLDKYSRELPSVFAHGDFQPGNVLVNGSGRVTGVFDWVDSEERGLPGVDIFRMVYCCGRDLRPFEGQLQDYADKLGVPLSSLHAIGFGSFLLMERKLRAVWGRTKARIPQTDPAWLRAIPV